MGMLVLEELWIGDLLRIKADGRIGRFEGMVNAQVKLLVGSKLMLLDAGALEIAPADTVSEPRIEEEEIEPFDPINFATTIDLHMSMLDPSRIQETPIQIRAYQLRRCREFVEEAIRLKIRTVTIIHGKGEGVLKADVLNVLDQFSEIKNCEEVHQGGGQLVRLEY